MFIFEKASFAACHASTIVQTTSGQILAAFFAGHHEAENDCCIWLCHCRRGQWSAPRVVANGVDGRDQHPTWNPVLFQVRGGPLLLFYKVGPNPREWWGMVKSSTDDGYTWSGARRLPDGILGPAKNKPIQLANGHIISPSSTEDNGWRIHFERSVNGGVSWFRTAPVDYWVWGADGIQPSILVHSQSMLQAVGRVGAAKCPPQIYSTWSYDGGFTWVDFSLLDLPNPNSGTDAVTLADGRHVLVYNHSATDRSPLNIAVSDNGVAWRPSVVLESEPGEFSYPAVIQSADGGIHVTYTWNRKRICHSVLAPGEL